MASTIERCFEVPHTEACLKHRCCLAAARLIAAPNCELAGGSIVSAIVSDTAYIMPSGLPSQDKIKDQAGENTNLINNKGLHKNIIEKATTMMLRTKDTSLMTVDRK